MHRSIPLRPCSNCGEVVCRRCAERRRELALCPACAAVESRAESPEFARVLMAQHRRASQGRADLIRTAAATLIPGHGLLAFRRVFTAILVMCAAAALAAGWFGIAGPFPCEAGLAVPDAPIPMPVVIVAWIALYAFSLGSYFSLVSRAKAQAECLAGPQRSRASQATGRTAAVA